MTARPEVELDAPGAGLPAVERWVLRYLAVPVLSGASGWERSSRYFEAEARRILALAAPLDHARLDTPVLIRRPPGIEDSSRRWSVTQTTEHLIIVGRSILDIILALTHGRAPRERVDIAAFKPTGRLDPSEFAAGGLAAFEAFAREYTRTIANDVGDRASRLRHEHPWFGGLTARQWHWLAAVHQRLHRRQVERITERLRE